MSGILVVTTSYPGGGQPAGAEAAGAFVRDFAIALNTHVPVTVVAPSISGAGIDTCTGDGLSILRYRVPGLPLSTLRSGNPAHLVRIIRTLASGAKAVRNAAADTKPDHMLAMWSLPCGYWTRKAERATGIPYSTWSLGSDVWSLGRKPPVSAILAAVLRDASCRFADGFGLCADVERISGSSCLFLPSSRSIDIGDRTSPARSSPPYRLSFLGRWHLNKGVDILLDAFIELDDEAWTSIESVRIHGGGPLEQIVRKKTSLLASAGHPVTCGGYLDAGSAVKLYLDSDYLVIPSRVESIPLVFSDAMQCRLPVVCTPVGDLPELLDRFGCGILSEGADPVSLAAAIGCAVSRDRGEMLAGTGRAAAEFTVDATVLGFLEAAGLQAGEAN